ncbi:MAG TPA: ATP-dependent zinc metalloprotease FtsH [Candidatus Micrarchaeia archaeon]|nr:ATP-dependent zinc metalloprotease FtsH [Candidatus Micrarchaeia archaeon]
MPPSPSNPRNKLLGSSPQWGLLLVYAAFTLATLWIWQEVAMQMVLRTIPYSQFKDYVRQGEVVQCSVKDTEIDGEIQPKASAHAQQAVSSAIPKPSTKEAAPPNPKPTPEEKAVGVSKASSESKGAEVKPKEPAAFMFRTVRVDDPDLVSDLEKANVKFSGVKPGFMSQFLWYWVLPIGVMLLIWRFLSRRMKGFGQSVMRFGASGAKLVADTDTKVTFNDVAGCEEAKFELEEVVTFLKHPERYRNLGAKIPKGVLLVGPPGTGKTLLARAVAGEAKVPFFSINGSEFVEMFVGVGAARVRDLFQQAKSHAPCIVFIDELDAVGRQRGVHIGAVNDEREQTLNQLLVGLDGFEANTGVVVLAATNRPDVLDRALLRPGRFDRQVVVDAPDLQGREAILKLHAKGKPLEPGVDLRRIAQETPGFSGADLANTINEAALLAARHDGTTIGQKDLEEAVEKVVAGPERKSRRLSSEDRRRVAYHEVGHALVAAFCNHGDTVRKISIVPRGRAALGYTLQLPADDQYLMSKAELTDKVRGMLGGRAAEEVVFGEITTGAENDLESATALVRQMICMYGMGESVGLAYCAQQPNSFLPAMGDGLVPRDCSEETAREIDKEVRNILDSAYRDSKQLLHEHRAQMDLVAGELLLHETLDAQAFKDLIDRPIASR